METLFTRQLQQAWLETQVRKQSSEFSSPRSVITFSSSQQTSSRSAPISPDSATETSTMSDPGQSQPQELDEEEGFGDHVIRYIHDMLMGEEDLNDRNCMLLECVSQMKEFYDILGVSEGPSACENQKEDLDSNTLQDAACKEELSALVNGDAHPFTDVPVCEGDIDLDLILLSEGDAHIEVSTQNVDAYAELAAHNDGPSKVITDPLAAEPLRSPTRDESDMRVPAHHEDDRDEYKWIDDFLNNLDAITTQQDDSAGVAPSGVISHAYYPGFSSSLSSHISSQLLMDGGSLREQEPLLKLDSSTSGSVLAGFTSHNLQRNSNNIQHSPGGIKKHAATVGSTAKDSSWSYGSRKSSSSVPSGKLSNSKASVSTNGRLKRPATELDAAVVSSSMGSSSSAGTGGELDAMEEETVSFVQNEDLGAEKCGSILNDGIGSLSNTICKSTSASVREVVGRTAIVVTTVADLKGLLISCAQAVASNNLQRAQEILREIRQDASPYGSGLQRLAHYFAEALVARLSGTGDRLYSVFTSNSPSAAKLLKAHGLYVEVCPVVKISHYFANKAIHEAAKGASRLHIIDYGILYGIQWPCLISALACREGGPPLLRITGIDFPQPGNDYAERVEMTGKRLSEYARTYKVPFEYHAIASRWEIIEPSSLHLSSRQDEIVIVNCMHRLHHLLDETVLASNPRMTVLSKIHEINPKIFVQGIKNGNYSAPFFMSRFKEALASFSGHFDMLDTLIKADSQERLMIEREVLGRDILNVIACEGSERVERPETYRQWQNRTQRAGFEKIPLDRMVLKDTQTVVRCHYNKNFTVDEDGSWMLLSWKGRVANALSLWKPSRH